MQALSPISTKAKDFYFATDGIIFYTGTGISAAFNADNKLAKEKLLKEFDKIFLSLYRYMLPGHQILTLFRNAVKEFIFRKHKKRYGWVLLMGWFIM